MEFRFDVWMLDVDVNATQHDYSKNDYSQKEKQLNEELKESMSFQQSLYF